MNTKRWRRTGIGAAIAGGAMLFTAAADAQSARGSEPRSGYSYLRLITGDVTVDSKWNGRVEGRRNMPISAGDEIIVSDPGRAEVGLADGNVLHVGGGSRATFETLYDQQGESDDFSSIRLRDGSLVLSAIGQNDDQIPRIDTEDATIYLSAGARARVNVDSRRGTVVIDRNGPVEVRTRAGSYKLRAGQYLTVRGDEDPEIDRGSFSRDRFDLWVADRIDTMSDTSRSASARYVDQEYASDVEALDGYGDWSYSSTYSSNVWVPRVEIGWTPYSFGSWYYTPAGLTWWSNDPWGWYPHHYGNWFFDASFNRWCWSPASVYSPAWVFWAYTPSYVGWCPAGLYSGFSPWWDTYYRRMGWTRPNAYIALHGTFNPRQVNFRGWNFTGANGFGSGIARTDVIPGARLGDRLGGQVAISSHPIVVTARPGEAREAVRQFIHEAPRVIERASAEDTSRLAPILARERTLPAASVEALRDRTVVADRGRLTGPAAADLAPRGARFDRGPAAGENPERGLAPERGRTVGAAEPPAGRMVENPVGREPAMRSRPADSPATRMDSRTERAPAVERAPGARSEEDWRARGRATATGSDLGARVPERNERIERVRPNASSSPSADWRSRRLSQDAAPRAPARDRTGDGRDRDVPPARRVIEGAVPGRRAPEARVAEPRDPEVFRAQPARPDSPPRSRSESAPAPRAESHPAPAPSHQAPPPSHESHSDHNRKDR